MKLKFGKILITLMLAVLFMLPAFSAFAADTTEALPLSATRVTIGNGELVNIYEFINEKDKDQNTYTYKVGNSAIASVNKNGLVKGLSKGKTRITIKREVIETPEPAEGEEETPKPIVHKYSAAFTVYVKDAPTSVKLSAKNIALKVKKTYSLKGKVYGGFSRQRNYTSSDEKIATVDSNGKVKALRAGKVRIYFSTFNHKRAYCNFTITKKQPQITVITNTRKIQKGADCHRVVCKVSSGLKTSFKLSSSNKKIAKIDKNGYVTGVRKGKFYVDIKTNYDNLKAKHYLTVVDDALILNRNSVQLAYDNTNLKRTKYGKSSQGRNLEGFEIINKKTGKYKKTLFIDFTVHGFEDWYYRDGKVLTEEANALIKYFTLHSEELGKYRLVIVPCANPDGAIAGVNNKRACSSAFGRCTAKHVDMNRDFGAFRAVESRKLRKYILDCNPNLYMNMHGWLNETLGSYKLSHIVNRNLGLSGYISSYGGNQGYVIGWVHNHLGIPATLVEYRSPGSVSTKKDIKMIKAVIKAY